MVSSPQQPQRSSGRHMLHGSFWMIALRWTIRSIGLVSTIILARLLTPADFGIVAMAMIVVGMLEILNQTGQKLAIIRLENPTREDYDTAWTISVGIGLLIGAVILAIAPFSKAYFHEPRAVLVMQCLALRAVLGGFENIGIVDFRRDIRFDRFFRYNAIPKVFSFFVTIGLAWYLRSYWALVAGILTGQFVTTVLSYIMHPYRPRLSLARISQLRSFSTWTLVKSLGTYATGQIDQIVVGGIAGASSMGRYAVASDVSTSPSRELSEPMVAVLFPVMAKLQGDPVKMRALYLRILGWNAIICTSASVGVLLTAPEIVHLVLGPKWLDVEPLIGWLALSGGLMGLSGGAYTLFDTIGKPQIGARLQWVRVFLLAAAIIPIGLLTHDLTAIAASRLGVSLLFLPTLFFSVGHYFDVTPWNYFETLWRPLMATLIMAVVVTCLHFLIPLTGFSSLVLKVVSGAASYTASLLLLWQISGRPVSAELDLMGIFSQGWKRLQPG